MFVCIIYKGHKQLVLEGATSFFNNLDETCRKENKEDRLVICESYFFFFIGFLLVVSLLFSITVLGLISVDVWHCHCSSEVQTMSKDQLRHMEGTVVLHITFAVKQDQDLGKEFIKYLKVLANGWFLKYYPLVSNILVICACYNCSYCNKNFFEKLLAESL